MATTNKSLIQQTYNTSTGNLPANQVVDPAYISTPYSNWSVPINYDYGAIDLALGGSVSISVTSVVTDQAMVLSQYQPLSIIFSGVLSASLTYTLPSSVGGLWAVYNNTTGALTFTLKMATPAGTSLNVTIPAGGPYMVTCNSTSGISIPTPSDGSITAAKLFGTIGTGNVVLAISPTLTGTPLAPTATGGTNTTQIATTAFVTTAVGAITSTGRLLRAPQMFITAGSGTYTTPAGCTSIYVECVGGGGGGGGTGNSGLTNAGTGGGGGGYSAKYFTITPSTGYLYAVAAGGASSISVDATNGGNTTFTVSATTITGGGGIGGQRSNAGGSIQKGSAGGTATNGDINASGSASTTASPSLPSGGAGSFFGGAGLAGTTGTGSAGSSGGGGGGGGGTSNLGGAGGAGVIRIWEYS